MMENSTLLPFSRSIPEVPDSCNQIQLVISRENNFPHTIYGHHDTFFTLLALCEGSTSYWWIHLTKGQ